MEDTILRLFFEHGAIGIMALGFCLTIFLAWKSDRRNSLYAARLEDNEFDRGELLRALEKLNGTMDALRQHCSDRWHEHVKQVNDDNRKNK